MNSGKKAYTSEGLAHMAFLGICIVAVMWIGLEWNCMSLYATSVMEELGITRTVFMFTLTIDAGVSALVSLFLFGRLEQRFGIRKLILFGGFFDTISFLLWAFAPNVVVFYLGSFMYGVGGSVTGYTCVTAAVNRWYKMHMGRVVGVVNTCGSIAGIASSLLIAVLIAFVGWRASFLVSFGLSAAALVAAFFLYKGDPEDLGVEPMYAEEARALEASLRAEVAARESGIAEESARNLEGSNVELHEKNPLDSKPSAADFDVENSNSPLSDTSSLSDDFSTQGLSYAQSIRHPRFLVMAGAYLLMGIVTYAVMASLALFAHDLGFDSMQGVAVSVSLAASAVMLSPLGAVCDRFGSKWGLAWCSAMILVACLLLRMHSLPLAGLLIASACSGAAYSCCIVPIGVSVKEAFGERDFSRKLGVPAGCSIVGISLAPVIINFFYELFGNYDLVLLLFGALAIATAFVFQWATRRSY